jgi:hypothetical protein
MGAVDPMAFDKMIEAAASAPRRYGLAPKSSEMFPTHMVRKIGCLTNIKQYIVVIKTILVCLLRTFVLLLRIFRLTPKSSEMFPTHMVSKIGCWA